jgi:hypothetical protein
MIPGSESAFGLATDFGLLVLSTAVLVAVAAKIYPRVVA